MSGLEARGGQEAEVSARREVAGQRSAARERRLCVAVNDYAGVYGKAGDYRIAKGY